MAGHPLSSDRIKERLTEKILSGELRPGDILKENVLAEEFGVSRTPIREAIRQVAATGLITMRPHQRSIVSKLELADALAMFEATSAIEGVAAEFAARRRSSAELKAIRDIHEKSAALVAADRLTDYFDLNETLHEAIYTAANNPHIADTAIEMRAKLRLLRGPRLAQADRLRHSFEEHTRIIAAIETGDPLAASTAMRNHTMMQGESLMSFINQFTISASGKAAE